MLSFLTVSPAFERSQGGAAIASERELGMNEITTLLQQLVAIDSINPDLVAGGAGEREIAHFVANWLERAGVEVTWDEPVPGRPSVIGIVRGTGGGRSLLLNAHMDTVGVAGMERPHDPVVEGNRLYGRGAYDMKGGLAAIMVAAAQAKKLSLRGDVILTAVAEEHHDHEHVSEYPCFSGWLSFLLCRSVTRIFPSNPTFTSSNCPKLILAS